MPEVYFNVNIAGVSFKNKDKTSRQTVVKGLEPGQPLILKREKRNKYDKNAVAVHTTERQAGYLPRHAAATVAPVMDHKVKVQCHVVSKGPADNGMWGATVRVSWDDA